MTDDDDFDLDQQLEQLLLRVSGGEVFTHPLAGSARRASEPAQDEMVARDLLASRKDQHEHKLVIDEIRRVLTPHCRELAIPAHPSLMSTDTLWHLGTPIAGRLNGGEASVLSLACQLHPTPALCGHPREDALALIDVRVLDHFIVGDGEPLSMAEYGWM